VTAGKTASLFAVELDPAIVRRVLFTYGSERPKTISVDGHELDEWPNSLRSRVSVSSQDGH